LEPPPQIRSPRVRGLFAYWNRIRAGRMAPSWSEVEPGEIKSLLPYLMVAEVLVQPFDVRYRIVGTAVAEVFGCDFTWKTLRSLKCGSGTSSWLGIYREIVERRGPCFGQYRIMAGLLDVRIVDTGAFPLSSDGVSIDRFIELEDWQAVGGFKPGAIEPEASNFTMFPEPPT
jgi:hypothetical protein